MQTLIPHEKEQTGVIHFIKTTPYVATLVSVTSVGIFLALVVAFSAVELIGHVGNRRCILASPIYLIPPSTDALGITIGEMELTQSAVYWSLKYSIPITEGQIETVQIRGPIDMFGVGTEANSNNVLLTLCGGEISCETMEQVSCNEESLVATCGYLKGYRRHLDTVTPDHPLPGKGSDVHRLTSYIKHNPGQVYLLVTTQAHPDGAHRYQLNDICIK